MNKNLKDYIKVYDGLLSQSLCEQVITELQSVEFKIHKFYSVKENNTHTLGNDSSYTTDVIPSSQAMNNAVWHALKTYMTKDIQFPWFDGWEGFTTLKYNKYDVNTNMKDHCDHIHSIFDGNRKGIPILTVLGSLNDNYSGGELVFFTDEVYELKAGQVMVFPSLFLYPHRINTVTSGTRYSFASWTW
jgi:predicted 2-oxoglutarate/Fe(II)-dependent dioxygenase YbiX